MHNYLIFNVVSITDHIHYQSNNRIYHKTHRASDQLCREHSLSVIVLGRDKKQLHRALNHVEQHSLQGKAETCLWPIQRINGQGKFLRDFESKIILFEAAAKEIRRPGFPDFLPPRSRKQNWTECSPQYRPASQTLEDTTRRKGVRQPIDRT